MYILYNSLLLVAALFGIPYYTCKMIFTGKYRTNIGPKFGFIKPEIFHEMKGSPRIWIHAVSVGEVTAAAPIAAFLRKHFPDACIILSTGTVTGQEMARSIVNSATSFIYYPLDIPFVVKKVVDQAKPDIVVLTESELWPNFIRICKERGVKIIMVNGRISPRSFKKYALTSFFWKGILNAISEVGVISEIDALRLKALGMPSSRVRVMGNAKYDSLAAKVSPEIRTEMKEKLNLTNHDKVFIAGSTHDGEENIILNVYRSILQKYHDFKLIIVPRHPERGQAVLNLMREAGFDDSITMSEINSGRHRRDERVIIIDVIGELFKAYSLATVVFCGGSLVSKGGQNILEPAAWGNVVFYGPHMEDFREERDLLEGTGAGMTVRSEKELLNRILDVYESGEIPERGEAGRLMVVANMGAAQRYADMIQSHLTDKISRH